MTRPGSSDELLPPIEDNSGYRVRERDLAFLSISDEQIASWRQREHPLGMSAITYPEFERQFVEALIADGLATRDCDVRLKGSAVEFFSGAHKELPRSEPDIIRTYLQHRGRTPEAWELGDIVDRLDRVWLSDGAGPRRRPFDSMYRLNIAQYPSDFDVQLSSDELVARCAEILAREGRGVEELTVQNSHYDFVERYLVQKAAPNLYLFGLRMTDALGRGVNIAVFPSSGPREVPNDPLSSHFHDTDWRLDLHTVVETALT